jgi:hypothetical protein
MKKKKIHQNKIKNKTNRNDQIGYKKQMKGHIYSLAKRRVRKEGEKKNHLSPTTSSTTTHVVSLERTQQVISNVTLEGSVWIKIMFHVPTMFLKLIFKLIKKKKPNQIYIIALKYANTASCKV